MAQGVNERAMQATIRALRELGRLESVDEAMVAAARTLARAVDRDPGNAALWREYRAVEDRLRSAEHGNDELNALGAEMRAAMGDPPNPEP